MAALQLNTLLAPGMAVMRRLRMPVKLLLLSAVLLVPLVLLLFTQLQRSNADLAYTRGEVVGTDAVEALLTTALYTQAHRGQTNQVLSGNEAARAARETTRKSLREAIARPLAFACQIGKRVAA